MADAKKTIIEVRHIITGELASTIDATGKPRALVENTLYSILCSMGDDYCATIAEVANV